MPITGRITTPGRRSKQAGGGTTFRSVSTRQIAMDVIWRLARTDKRMLARRLWLGAKGAALPQVSIEDLPGVSNTLVTGWPGRVDALVLAALATNLGCGTFFEFGTFRGRTSWTVAHNNPTIRVFSLDLPSPESAKDVELEVTDRHLFQSWGRGEAIAGTPEAARITLLTGDSARFDYSPFHGQMDLVYVDGSHSYSYVRSDTESALRLLSPLGTIVWDDFYYPGVWKYLHEINGTLPWALIATTGMAVHSRHPALANITQPLNHGAAPTESQLHGAERSRVRP